MDEAAGMMALQAAVKAGLGLQEATELLNADTGVGGNRGWPVGCGGSAWER